MLAKNLMLNPVLISLLIDEKREMRLGYVVTE
jgi:hypothetical protein